MWVWEKYDSDSKNSDSGFLLLGQHLTEAKSFKYKCNDNTPTTNKETFKSKLKQLTFHVLILHSSHWNVCEYVCMC